MKVGDLVLVHPNITPRPDEEPGTTSVVLDVCEPHQHRNGMHLAKLLINGQTKWLPVGLIRGVISESW